MKFFFIIFFLLTTAWSHAQSYSRYIIRFKDKANSPYSISNPAAYLSQRAVDRRTRYNIAVDSTDLPVTPRYLDSVRLAGNVVVLNVSRWLNQVSIQTTDATALAKINSFSFVQALSPVAARLYGQGKTGSKEVLRAKVYSEKVTLPFQPSTDFYSYGASYAQIHIHNGEFLHNIGLRGQGMIIGMQDAGFFNYTSLKAFDSVNRAGQVLGVYDFVDKDNSVVENDAHGMECFSVIAANVPGQFVGSSPKASFYLFRSEDSGSEYPIEEHNWVCAAERVDSAGGDVISSSLGYNTFNDQAFNHAYADMNGNTTIAAIGADLAAKKGVLVVSSAGNEGDNAWGKITTPADGDSVLAVGAVYASGAAANFSSRGPSSDGQVKPDVASVGVGTVIQGSSNTIITSNGTSFSCPNIAGLAACLWQGFPEFNNAKILKVLQRAGNRYGSPNDSTGYGIPDMRLAVMLLLKDFSSATATSASACKASLTWQSKDVAGMKYEVERKAPGETSFAKIGEAAAKGKEFSAQQYQFSDSLLQVQAGDVVYRIRQIIDTASATADYIDTVTLNLAATCTTTPVPNVPSAGSEYLVSPNPATNTLTLRITTPTAIPHLFLRITDGKGSTVLTKETTKPSGTSTFDFPLSTLQRGKYYLLVYNGEKRLATREFMKL